MKILESLQKVGREKNFTKLSVFPGYNLIQMIMVLFVHQ